MSSILPLIVGGLIYYFALRKRANGIRVWQWIVGVLTPLSTIGNFTMAQLPDGSATPDGFAGLTVPMHVIAGALAFFIPFIAARTKA
jgi:hypothetical protein